MTSLHDQRRDEISRARDKRDEAWARLDEAERSGVKDKAKLKELRRAAKIAEQRVESMWCEWFSRTTRR